MAEERRPAGPTGSGEHDGDDAGAEVLRSFGKQLKIFRTLAGLSQVEFGERLGYSEALVASVEQGRRIPTEHFIEKADEVLGAKGILAARKEEVARVRYPSFFRDAARVEAQAVELHFYDTHVVNGLFQTEEYARAVFGMRRPLLDEETIEQRVAARLARQEILSRGSAPLMSSVIEESVLRRPVGGGAVHRGQLEQLLLLGQKRNVELQVMPLDREDHAGLSGAFTLMETSSSQRVAYVEVQNVSRLHVERKQVRDLEAQYGIIRAQAFTPRESMVFIERLLGEL
ncbi:helix-turn-helix transcriptional regulator [Streptomyces sp. DH12]|uniref:helix-turn-helix domain-containing protein n=1 Tax=Streptomyces sp. DH12 TaxID=2857010 RepID=UPI001E4565F7|nr:helix-turn-helix transcriptional regulator [Streptomyces sp. DH12]